MTQVGVPLFHSPYGAMYRIRLHTQLQKEKIGDRYGIYDNC